MTDQQAHELISELAQIMVGYEPVTYQQMVDRANELSEKAKLHEQNSRVSELFDEIESLAQMAQDIKEDA